MDYKKLVKVADSGIDALEWAHNYIKEAGLEGSLKDIDACVDELYAMTRNASDVELDALAKAIYILSYEDLPWWERSE